MSLKIVKKVEVYGQNIEIDCIVSVINIRGNKKEMIADCQFINNDKIIEATSYLFTPLLDKDNFIKQAYEYLKTLEEFKDAEDC